MPRRWAVDLADCSGKDLCDPPGYSETYREEHDTKLTEKRSFDMAALKLKKAKETAWAPAKSFMMTAFMLWMSGSGVHPFSIMMTGYAVYNPINSALSVNKQFKPFADPKADATMRGALLMAKATFVVLNLLAMSGALYKMNTMGLLPNTPSDWASFLVVPPPVQVSTGSQISAPLAH
mmetsp:Transcript_35601/g.117154  ORF Transcript_35601/g.117154 Transcript_35601/m.117154 type:complete len:178 (-) Transcript_35601:199-732(-)